MYRFFPLVYSPLKVRVDSCFSTMPKLQPRIVYSTINVKERQVPALWRELYENFSFLLLQNMVRGDVFSGFFCGFDSCGSAAFRILAGGLPRRRRRRGSVSIPFCASRGRIGRAKIGKFDSGGIIQLCSKIFLAELTASASLRRK